MSGQSARLECEQRDVRFVQQECEQRFLKFTFGAYLTKTDVFRGCKLAVCESAKLMCSSRERKLLNQYTPRLCAVQAHD